MRIFIAAILACLLTAGCTSTGMNRDYARNCGYAMDQLLMCGGYDHEF